MQRVDSHAAYVARFGGSVAARGQSLCVGRVAYTFVSHVPARHFFPNAAPVEKRTPFHPTIYRPRKHGNLNKIESRNIIGKEQEPFSQKEWHILGLPDAIPALFRPHFQPPNF
jgi:hypothetical protein